MTMITPASTETVRIPKELSKEVAAMYAEKAFEMEKETLIQHWGKPDSLEYNANKEHWLDLKAKSIIHNYKLSVYLGSNY